MPPRRAIVTAYQKIIDQLVSETRPYSAYAARMVSEHPFPAGHREFNELLASLSKRQRHLLSKVLLQERDAAIHDVLAVLSWWIECQGVGLTHDGKPMQVDLSGAGLHGDYVGRCAGGDWSDWSDEA